jgi:uncharacterized LabA/DUF88 family protein
VDTRVLWLIDASFIFKNLKSITLGFKIDYKKLRRAVQQRCGLISEAIYCNSTPEEPEPAMVNFHNMLAKPPPDGAGFILVLHKIRKWPAKDVYCEACGEKVSAQCPVGAGHKLFVEQQKGVDVAIATHALTKLASYDKLVLSSGDGDLAPAMRYIKDAGKQFILVAFKQNVSSELREIANQEFTIDSMAGEVIYG